MHCVVRGATRSWPPRQAHAEGCPHGPHNLQHADMLPRAAASRAPTSPPLASLPASCARTATSKTCQAQRRARPAGGATALATMLKGPGDGSPASLCVSNNSTQGGHLHSWRLHLLQVLMPPMRPGQLQQPDGAEQMHQVQRAHVPERRGAGQVPGVWRWAHAGCLAHRLHPLPVSADRVLPLPMLRCRVGDQMWDKTHFRDALLPLPHPPGLAPTNL